MPNFIFSFKLIQAVKLFIVVLVATAGFLGTGVEKVEAVSWMGESNCFTLVDPDEIASYGSDYYCEGNAIESFNYTVNTNKTSYFPGEVISLSSITQALYCSNMSTDYTINASLEGVTTEIDSGVGSIGYNTFYSTTNLTAPTIPGNYSITLAACTLFSCSNVEIEITVTAPPAPTAIISGTGCEIPVGASTCTGTLNWSISDAVDPNMYNWYQGYTVYPNTPSGVGQPVTLTISNNKFAARDGSTFITAVWIVGTCATGGAWDWDNSICAPDTPPASPVATISGTACEITAGNRSCDGSVTWDITDAVDPNVYNANGSTYSNSTNGNISNAELEYGLNTVYARDGVTQLNNVELLVTCASGTSWNGLVCDVIPPPPPAPAISIAVDRELVRSGESVTSNIEVTAAYPATCTVYGVQNAPVVFAHSGTPTTDTYSATTRTLTSSQVITVTCEASPAIPGVSDTTSEARVDVIPVMQEL